MSKKEIDFLADYFYYDENGRRPDVDGFLGIYFVDKKVMDGIKKKYDCYD